jgi:hypothetical protein
MASAQIRSRAARDARRYRPCRPDRHPIYATADGVVTTAGYNSGGYGNLIKIDHGRGIETRYGHLASLAGTSAAPSSAAS